MVEAAESAAFAAAAVLNSRFDGLAFGWNGLVRHGAEHVVGQSKQ